MNSQTSTFRMLIDGALVDGEQTMAVINPSTGQSFAHSPRASLRQMEQAINAASRSFPAWSRTTMQTRRALILRIADLIEEHCLELAHLLTQEQGKPLRDALAEVQGTAAFFRYVAQCRIETQTLEESTTRHAYLQRQPLGVVAVITPWNFPLMLLAFKVPHALLVGNTVVIKPAATTPLTTLKLGELIVDALPAGVVNIVTDHNDLGDALSSHPQVAKISFTGSTATGYKVMANAAKSLKRLTLELGGNDPGIVLDDADPKQIAPGIVRAAFFNSGQACIALKRLYVSDSLYEALSHELWSHCQRLVLGDGLDSQTTLGPLQNQQQFQKVKSLLEDARQHGRVLSAGTVPEGAGYFLPPTLVLDIEDGTRLVDEEQFGPVLPVIRYSNVEQAIAMANRSPYGLGASVWASDLERARGVADQLQAGTVWINQHIDLGPHIPQCGSKQSGFGIELGAEGLLEFTQAKVININPGLGIAAQDPQKEHMNAEQTSN